MQVRSFIAIAALAGCAASVNALTFECRWVERVGNVDTVIGGNGAALDLSERAPGSNARIRLQFRVVDDAAGPAPAGGFVGWNVGTLNVTGDATNSRTPGRLTPFVFAAQPTANGSPTTNPFTALTDIDATLGTQSPFWGCDANGDPLPQPNPTIRGRNTFISVFEFTTGGATGNYSVVAGGNLIAATEWRPVGTPIAPDCEAGAPGSVTYAPFPTDPSAFSCTLNLIVPAPGAAALLGLGGLLVARRRR